MSEPYDRQRPDYESLYNQLLKYAEIDYGITAFVISREEARLLINKLEIPKLDESALSHIDWASHE